MTREYEELPPTHDVGGRRDRGGDPQSRAATVLAAGVLTVLVALVAAVALLLLRGGDDDPEGVARSWLERYADVDCEGVAELTDGSKAAGCDPDSSESVELEIRDATVEESGDAATVTLDVVADDQRQEVVLDLVRVDDEWLVRWR